MTEILENQNRENDLLIAFESYESAKNHKRDLGDTVIEVALGYRRKEHPFLKNYLDNVDITDKDRDIINDPYKMKQLLQSEHDIFKNLHIIFSNAMTLETQDSIKRKTSKFFRKNFMEGAPPNLEYTGLNINNRDPLNINGRSDPEFRFNLKIQSQLIGGFIMGYSDERVKEKLSHTDRPKSQRIYLNPDPMFASQIFSEILKMSNEKGLSLQTKIWQRYIEFSNLKDLDRSECRGDGIIVFTSEKDFNKVLSFTLDIARKNPEYFKGRMVSKIPQPVAEGISIGDEPLDPGYSLTSSRAELLEKTAQEVLLAKKNIHVMGERSLNTKQLFKYFLKENCKKMSINPSNLAFNS